MKKCEYCGTYNSDGETVCSRCGTPMPEQQEKERQYAVCLERKKRRTERFQCWIGLAVYLLLLLPFVVAVVIRAKNDVYIVWIVEDILQVFFVSVVPFVWYFLYSLNHQKCYEIVLSVGRWLLWMFAKILGFDIKIRPNLMHKIWFYIITTLCAVSAYGGLIVLYFISLI